MAIKAVRHYAALGYKDGTTRINIYFTDGSEDFYVGLAPDRARLILDVLQNEKPVFWTEGPDILWTGREPVGEQETAFNVEGWLSERRAVRGSLVWESAGGPTPYDSWSPWMKTALEGAVGIALAGGHLVSADPPPLAVNPAAGATAATRLSGSTAWSMFLAYVAQSILADACAWVPWSLNSLSASELSQIFDGRSLFLWDGATATYRINFSEGAATPGDPVATFQFLAGNDLLGSSRRDTVYRLLGWCRDNMVHFSGGWDVENVENQWQYRGLPPVSRTIEGTIRSDAPTGGTRHRTGGCWGTTGFVRAVLRTVNVPVQLVTRAGHAQPHFMSEGLFLSHGDDPYNGNMRAVPEIPIAELPIDQSRHNAWFGPLLPATEVTNNIGRRATELGLEYLSNWLLNRRCDDIASGASHADSEVFDTLDRYWTVADLEAMDLWTKLDDKIASMGGCGSVPP